MLAVPGDTHPALSEQYATFVAYTASSNPWSAAMVPTLGCLPRLYRAQDAVFLLVDYERMSVSEQLHHRLSGLPALKMYCKVCILQQYIPVTTAHTLGVVCSVHACC